MVYQSSFKLGSEHFARPASTSIFYDKGPGNIGMYDHVNIERPIGRYPARTMVLT